MIINRKLVPAIQPITSAELLPIEAKKLTNGLPFYQLEGGDQQVVSLQLLFNAGRWFENKPLQAFLTASLLTEGTLNRSSEEVSEWIDFHGAQLIVDASYDVSTLSLVCLEKHLEPMLELMDDVLSNAAMRADELEIKKQISKQKLQVNQQKTDFVAQRMFHNLAFGESHPYGYASTAEKYDAINSKDVQSFRENGYLNSNSFAILSGNCSQENTIRIKNSLSKLTQSQTQSATTKKPLQTSFSRSDIDFPNAQQTSLRFGKPTIGVLHPDFAKLELANAILGGYFGSRLMSNLREDKGLTYGVYSRLGSFLNTGYWFVGTDVGKEHREVALEQIKLEVKNIQEHVVPTDELELVRNYMMGKYLSKVDGPFAQAKVYKTLILHGQSHADFQRRIDQLLHATAEDVQEMAQKYWSMDNMIEVLVG